MSNTVTVELRAAAARLHEALIGQGMQDPQVIAKDYCLVVIADPSWQGERFQKFEIWDVSWRDKTL